MLNRNNNNELQLKKIKFDSNYECYYPTPYECAALSYDTYKYEKVYQSGKAHWEEKPNFPPLPNGWKKYLISNPSLFDNDYCGVCYIKWDPNPVAIVFANRGTIPDYSTNINACLDILMNKQTQHAALATKFFYDTLQFIEEDDTFPRSDYEYDVGTISYTFTGHSLGGHSADFQFLKVCRYSTTHSITFDNPGSYDAIYNSIIAMEDKETREAYLRMFNKYANKSFNYVAHANAINTCNRHWGNVFLLKDLPFIYDINGFTPSEVIGNSVLKNLYYFMYTLNQHEMVNIYNYLKNGGIVELDLNHVNGVMDAFVDYLWIEKHSKYWNGYIDYIWTNNASVREKYGNIRLDFFEAMYDTIRTAQKEARQSSYLPLQEGIKVNNDLNNSKLTSSKLGLFGKQQKEIVKDFVMVNHNNPSVDTQEQYKAKGCAIM